MHRDTAQYPRHVFADQAGEGQTAMFVFHIGTVPAPVKIIRGNAFAHRENRDRTAGMTEMLVSVALFMFLDVSLQYF